jgi:hypothetical protein
VQYRNSFLSVEEESSKSGRYRSSCKDLRRVYFESVYYMYRSSCRLALKISYVVKEGKLLMSLKIRDIPK